MNNIGLEKGLSERAYALSGTAPSRREREKKTGDWGFRPVTDSTKSSRQKDAGLNPQNLRILRGTGNRARGRGGREGGLGGLVRAQDKEQLRSQIRTKPQKNTR